MLGRSAIDAGDIDIDALQYGGRDPRRLAMRTWIVFHRTLLHTAWSIREQGGGFWKHSPKRDHSPRGRVTNDKAATPRATLRNGLVSTTGGSASVPGCACDCMHPPPSPRDDLQFLA